MYTQVSISTDVYVSKYIYIVYKLNCSGLCVTLPVSHRNSNAGDGVLVPTFLK